MERKLRVRFAPSPTGPLHIGGVRTALYNWLLAKKNNGDFILRIEDTDQNRFVEGAEEYIINSLKWLGIEPNEGAGFGDGPYAPYRQSERKSLYKKFAEDLLDRGLAYYAFDTTEELEAMRDKLKASNIEAKYDAVTRQSMKNSLTLSVEEVKKRIESGESYVIRIKLPRKEEIRFYDNIRGWVVFNTSQMDDKVLLKHDGMPTYHLANVVDDILMEITHVIRGEEWLPSAPLHVLLYRYLGWEEKMPQFCHLPLLLKPDGNGKLSKRDGDRLGFPVFPLEWKDPITQETSSGYRESGYYPEAVVNMLALLGWHPSDNRELFSKNELIDNFSIEKVSKSGAKFDLNKAHWFNQQYLRAMDKNEIVKEVLKWIPEKESAIDTSYLSKVCELVKEKVHFAKEIPAYASYFFNEEFDYDLDVLNKKWTPKISHFIEIVHQEFQIIDEWNVETIHAGFHRSMEITQLKSGDVLQVFRCIVSGVGSGPPLFDVIELLGKNRVLGRLVKAQKIEIEGSTNG